MCQVQLVPPPLPRGITCTPPAPPVGWGLGSGLPPPPLWVWVWDLHTMSAEIAPEVPKPGKVDQEAFLGDSDRQETTTCGIPVAFHEETNHSVRNSRSLAPQLESTTCLGGDRWTWDLGHVSF